MLGKTKELKAQEQLCSSREFYEFTYQGEILCEIVANFLFIINIYKFIVGVMYYSLHDELIQIKPGLTQ